MVLGDTCVRVARSARPAGRTAGPFAGPAQLHQMTTFSRWFPQSAKSRHQCGVVGYELGAAPRKSTPLSSATCADTIGRYIVIHLLPGRSQKMGLVQFDYNMVLADTATKTRSSDISRASPKHGPERYQNATTKRRRERERSATTTGLMRRALNVARREPPRRVREVHDLLHQLVRPPGLHRSRLREDDDPIPIRT